MAKFCKYCGSLLDEASGNCQNCNKAEIINVNDEIKDSTNNISGQKKQKKAKQKEKHLLVKITATILALIIIISGTVGFLVYQGVFDSDLVKNAFEYIDVNKKVSSVDRNNAKTNDSDFTFYKSGDENIVQDIESGNSYVNNEVLITLDFTNSKSDLELLLSDIGAKIVGEIPAIAEYQVLLDEEYTYVELLDLCSSLEKNDWIISTSLNYVMDINPSYTPNDKKWNKKWDEVPEGTNWGLEAISATGAWDKKDEMQHINIGVIDTMFDLNHEDLSFAETPLGMAIINSELSKNERDWNNHGTHTSGTIAALFDNEKGISGIMPKSNLYGVAIWGLESASRTTLQTWKIAFYYLIAINNCKVINISMGYDQLCFNASRGSKAAISVTETYSNEIAEYLQILIDSDYEFVICKSAGNQNEVGGGYRYFRKDSDDTNTPYDYYSYSDYVAFLNGEEGYEYLEIYRDRQEEIEAKLESGNVSADFDFLAAITNEEVRDRIIIVGAVENRGSHKEGGFLWFGRKTVHDGYKIASFSQCGAAVDILAPGVDIYSTIQNGYENMSGTSMAAPHVSGVAGLVFAVNPNIDGKTVKEIICSSADGQYGEEKYGLLNAKKAVDYTENISLDNTDSAKTNAYDSILKMYYDGISSNWANCDSADLDVIGDPDNACYIFLHYEKERTLSEVGYSLIDINNDGQSELFVSLIDIADSGSFYDMYTINNGEVMHVISAGERDRYNLAEDLSINNDGSGGALNSSNVNYRLDSTGGVLKVNQAVVYDGWKDADNPYFYATSDYYDEESYEYNYDILKPISNEEAAKRLESFPDNKSIELIPFSEYKSQNSKQTVLTKSEIQELFITANNMFDGWLCHGWAPELDKNDIITIGGRQYAYIISDDFNSVSELEKELKNIFSEEIYKDYLEHYYIMNNGKMYGVVELGQGGDIYPNKLSLAINSISEKECNFTVTSYYEQGDFYSNNYKIRLINGTWIFVENFVENIGLYFNNDMQWIS